MQGPERNTGPGAGHGAVSLGLTGQHAEQPGAVRRQHGQKALCCSSCSRLVPRRAGEGGGWRGPARAPVTGWGWGGGDRSGLPQELCFSRWMMGSLGSTRSRRELETQPEGRAHALSQLAPVLSTTQAESTSTEHDELTVALIITTLYGEKPTRNRPILPLHGKKMGKVIQKKTAISNVYIYF